MHDVARDPDKEAEQSVLGALMIDPGSNQDVIAGLSEDLFKWPEHQSLSHVIKSLHTKGGEVDSLTVWEHSEACGRPVAIEYITELCEETHGVTAAKVASYVSILEDRRTRRQIVSAAENALESATGIIEIDECINHVQSLFSGISSGSGYGTESADSVMSRFSAELDERFHRKSGLVGLTSGFSNIDHLTGGFIGGLHTIGARPKMGKTTLALNISEANAKEGVPVFIASFEMPAMQLCEKMVSSISNVPFRYIKDPRLITDQDVFARIAEAVQIIAKLPIEFVDRSDAHIDKLCSSIRAWWRRNSGVKEGKGLAVVDYLQLIQLVKKERHDLSIADATRKLKNLSGELGIPILLLTQLNRSLEQRPNKRPTPADTRDSGSIEQDSDTLIFIYRDEVYNEDTDSKGIAEIDFSIARHHQAKRLFLAAQFDKQRFMNLAPDSGYGYE